MTHRDVVPELDPGFDYAEALVNRKPIVVRRRVRWGDCDPAGVVYTPRFAEYVVDARAWFFREILPFIDHPHPSLKQLIYPVRALSFDFIAYLVADDLFDMTLQLSNIGARSFTLDFAAMRSGEAGRRHFTASLTTVCVDQKTHLSAELPTNVRDSLCGYEDAKR